MVYGLQTPKNQENHYICSAEEGTLSPLFIVKMDLKEKISALLESELDGSDCFLTKVTVSANHLIRIYLDGDQGITIERCRKTSRLLEHHMEENGWVPEKYTLEVSSPGVEEPLVMPRQYPKHIGRKFEVTLKDGDKVKGQLEQVSEEGIVLKSQKKVKGKKEIIENQHELPFDKIEKALVKISF